MTIAELEDKIRLAEGKVAKIQNTIDKHIKGKDKKILALTKIIEENNLNINYDDVKDNSNWVYDYQEQPYYHDLYWAWCDVKDKNSAIISSNKKLDEANKVLQNWQEKLRLEQVKLQYIQDNVPEVIRGFLEAWKAKVIKYYNNKANEYPEALQEYRMTKEKLYYDILVETVNRLIEEDKELFIERYCHDNLDRLKRILDTLDEGFKPNNMYEYINLVRFGYRNNNDPDENPKYIRLENEWKSRFENGFFQSWLSRQFDPDWLEKEIEQEKNNKLIDLMTRVSKITGEITDAQYLYIADDGNLNGYIIGKDGKAEVETIGAGGYNEHVILDSGRRGQCYHFRVLVKPKK